LTFCSCVHDSEVDAAAEAQFFQLKKTFIFLQCTQSQCIKSFGKSTAMYTKEIKTLHPGRIRTRDLRPRIFASCAGPVETNSVANCSSIFLWRDRSLKKIFLGQGYQMVYLQTQNHKLGKFWRASDWKMLIYAMANFMNIWDFQ
jgi:hypothetical protein